MLVRTQETFTDLDCEMTFDQKVVFSENSATVSVVCFVSEEDVREFYRVIELPRPIDPAQSTFGWESEGKVHLVMKKADGPSYWPSLIKLDPEAGSEVDQRIAMWKLMTQKYAE